ncbi:hypothetical protein SDRG_01498 [Saprolegnia diclina VS20]|uniref:FYVE-type domain-containing protein n=1 Tax=Saprolegnia diclina (strain VS20) TaxID=1156394 RepID=T0R5A0_SAPDV|nr:hypothetical protein SDRG_01498 [Saprolegnia diclina VS20]EQC41535.1 hypothetical protein SDRG_01498 [Saprolegnia diclina VS20]|eukprot:XP_008605249.1 hypothetical protein SDRG_01498 [Saprolegnia diclina VS20]
MPSALSSPVVYRLEHFKPKREWVPDKRRSSCAACNKQFLLRLRRKHHCRRCGDVVCRACSQFVTSELPLVGLTPVRVCRPCIIRDITSDTLDVNLEQLLVHHDTLYRTTELILFSPLACSKAEGSFRERHHSTFVEEDEEVDVEESQPRRPKWSQFKALFKALVPTTPPAC